MVPDNNAQAILERAITKAIDDGWEIPFEEPLLSFVVTQDDVEGTYQTEPYIRFELDGTHDWCVGIPTIIFNHDFAKALWGEYPNVEVHMMPELTLVKDSASTVDIISYPKHNYKVWQYHLQQMVIANDYIKYLDEHIDD